MIYFQRKSENQESSSVSELWISLPDEKNKGSFVFRHFEDEWNDWPYPHTMEHILSGRIISKNAAQNIENTEIYFESAELTLDRMIYRTLTQDDLFYELSMEIFDLQKEEDSQFSRKFKKLCEKERNFLFPVRPVNADPAKGFQTEHPSSFLILNVPESKWPKISLHINSGILSFSWARLPKKWSLHSDGTDAVCGGIQEMTELTFIPEGPMNRTSPEIPGVFREV